VGDGRRGTRRDEADAHDGTAADADARKDLVVWTLRRWPTTALVDAGFLV
jgi:hypothetical protein